MSRHRLGRPGAVLTCLALLASLAFSPAIQAQNFGETSTSWQRITAAGEGLWSQILGAIGWGDREEDPPELISLGTPEGPGIDPAGSDHSHSGGDTLAPLSTSAGLSIDSAGFTGDDITTLYTESNQPLDSHDPSTEGGPGIDPAGFTGP